VGGVGVADLVGLDGEDGGVAAEVRELRRREADGEAGGSGGVGVEEGGWLGGGREGAEDGSVPVVVCGEKRGLLRLRHVDYVGSWSVR